MATACGPDCMYLIEWKAIQCENGIAQMGPMNIISLVISGKLSAYLSSSPVTKSSEHNHLQ